MRRSASTEGYQVGVVSEVRARHVMEGEPGPEGRPHAHHYRIEVVAGAAELDERGMVCDIDVLTQGLSEVLDRIRGQDLGPFVPEASSVTVEALARWLHGQLASVVAREGGQDLLVRVWEHPQAFGAYRGDPRDGAG